MSQPAGSLRSTAGKPLDIGTEQLIHNLRLRVIRDDWSSSPRMNRLLGELAAEIEARPSPANRYSAQSSLRHLRNLLLHPDVTSPCIPELAGTTCLDFGCGSLNPLGGMFAMLLAGAERGFAMDIDDTTSPRCAVRALFTVLAALMTGTTEPQVNATPTQMLERVGSFDIGKLAVGDTSGIDGERLWHIQQPLEQAHLPSASIDICFSDSVFEHIGSPDQIMAEMARITKPGGLAVHAIDGWDHRHYGNSDLSIHEFLFDDSDAAMLHGCNRIRPLQYPAIFERHGFEVRAIVEGRRTPLSSEERGRLAPQYRELPQDVLEVTRARFYLRRN